MIFSKSYCPHCKGAKYTLKTLVKELRRDISYKVVELDKLPKDDGEKIQNQLKKITNQNTVPSIFIAHVHIGGNSDLQALHDDGRLRSTLLAAVDRREEDAEADRLDREASDL